MHCASCDLGTRFKLNVVYTLLIDGEVYRLRLGTLMIFGVAHVVEGEPALIEEDRGVGERVKEHVRLLQVPVRRLPGRLALRRLHPGLGKVDQLEGTRLELMIGIHISI